MPRLPRPLALSLLLALPAVADEATDTDCPGFGLASDYLVAVFCAELAGIPQTTWRGVEGDHSDTVRPADDWLALPLIDAAWRSDPAKTLALIARIRAAGGVPVDD